MLKPSRTVFPIVQKHFGNEDMPLLFYFSASWCSYCVQQKPLVEKLEKAYSKEFKVIRIDLDKDPDFAADAGIQTIPALIFINRNKTRGGMILGRQNESQLNAFIAKAMSL